MNESHGKRGRLISIHSPRAGRDPSNAASASSRVNFNPLAPCGARLYAFLQHCEADTDFNPLAPCGARLDSGAMVRPAREFQSTRPVRGETNPSRS